ncbi:hypothetical protein SFRURICE_005651, partial [Spodoptera frugiperda]
MTPNLWITQRVPPCGNRTCYTLCGSRLPSHRANQCNQLRSYQSMNSFAKILILEHTLNFYKDTATVEINVKKDFNKNT